MVKNLTELFQEVCSTSDRPALVDDIKRRIDRSVYRGTSCGAWVSYQRNGVTVGSIVEGCDYGTQSYALEYPFDKKDFWGKLEEVEKEATSIWNNTHGCDACYPDNPENVIVNPNCSECKGSGTII